MRVRKQEHRKLELTDQKSKIRNSQDLQPYFPAVLSIDQLPETLVNPAELNQSIIYLNKIESIPKILQINVVLDCTK